MSRGGPCKFIVNDFLGGGIGGESVGLVGPGGGVWWESEKCVLRMSAQVHLHLADCFAHNLFRSTVKIFLFTP